MKRIYHPWYKWECYKAGFYNTVCDIDSECAKNMYRDFLKDSYEFEIALNKVITTWKYSCEHFLTNQSINKIAWLGQASACISIGLPCKFRSGFNLLTIEDKKKANLLALKYYEIWKKRYIHTLENGNNVDIQLEFQMKFHMN